MAGKQLTSQNATITTASVQIKTLTVSGKQVTQAVFRQLREERLIARDGYLNGTPWGYVNYHPDKCADGYRPHHHIVWQQGEDLLRGRVDDEPDWTDRDGGIEPFASCQTDDLLDLKAVEWVFTEDLPQALPSGVVNRGQQAQVSAVLDARYASLFSRTHFWDRCGVRISGKPSDEMLKAVELRVREHGWKSTDGDCAEPDLQRGAKCAADARKAASAVRSELVESYGDLNGVRTAYEQVIEAEAARRQRHVNLLKSLADLPQLFIAV